jgi:chorismate mutase
MTGDEAKKLLAECRVKIDDIDRQLVELLNRRTLIVEDIGRAKSSAGMPIYEPRREDDVYRNILAQNKGPLTADALRRIYERIIDEMRSLQKMRAASSDSKGDA